MSSTEYETDLDLQIINCYIRIYTHIANICLPSRSCSFFFDIILRAIVTININNLLSTNATVKGQTIHIHLINFYLQDTHYSLLIHVSNTILCDHLQSAGGRNLGSGVVLFYQSCNAFF